MSEEIGYGVTIRYITVGDDLGGVLVEHDVQPGEPFYGNGIERGASTDDRCCGAVQWRGEGAKHRLTQLDPLTIAPSIQCKAHPEFHGYIVDGKWTPC